MNQAVITFTNSTARASAITSPVEGMVTYLADTDTYQFWNGSAWTALVPASGGGSGNAIINGAFEINQRNFTSTTTTNAYGFDRFKLSTSGGTSTYSAQAFTPGTAPVAGYEAANFARVVVSGQSGSSDLSRLIQGVEDVRSFAGQTVTMSFWAKAATGTPFIGVTLEQLFGSGGSADTQTIATRQAITTSWARYSFTVTLPSLTGKTIGTGSSLFTEIWFSSGTGLTTFSNVGIQNNTFDIWGVQIEAGSTATPFRRNANSLQGELAACQRYYVRYTGAAYNNVAGRGNAKSTTQANIYVQHPVTMRVGALAIDYSNLALWDEVAAPSVTNAVLDVNNTQTAVVTMTVASGLTQFRNYASVASSVGTGFIGFSAEL
jgi:hypothetical protein